MIPSEATQEANVGTELSRKRCGLEQVTNTLQTSFSLPMKWGWMLSSLTLKAVSS